MIGLGSRKLERIAKACADWLEEQDENATVGVVMLVVEVKTDDAAKFVTYCSDGRPWVQRAVLREAADAHEEACWDSDEEGDDE